MPYRHGVPPIYRWHKLCNKDLLSKRHEACYQTSITSTCTSTCGSKADGGGADITTNTVGQTTCFFYRDDRRIALLSEFYTFRPCHNGDDMDLSSFDPPDHGMRMAGP